MNTGTKRKNKPGAGRPPLEEKRTARVTTVTTEENKEAFSEAAIKMSVSEASFLRMAANLGFEKLGLQIAI